MLLVMNETEAYRLGALLELAASFPEPRTAAQIARRRDVPARFLARLLGELAREGLVTTSRGPRGGVRLATRPEVVSLASLVRPEPQPEAGGVAVRWLAKRLAGARAGALEKFTLADLVQVERNANAAVDFDI
jgi:DNA-binding IscR family transcriptional regulator